MFKTETSGQYRNIYLTLIMAIFLAKIPVINLPLVWFETFFHELSHILVGLLTGGKVTGLELHWNGDGACFIHGGIDFLTFIAGYLGAPLWGIWLYSIGTTTDPSRAMHRTRILQVLLIISTVLWVRDGTTFLIIGFLFSISWLISWRIEEGLIRQITRFCGLYVMFNAIHSPLYIHSDRIQWDDGVALALITDVPKVAFIILWYGFALFLLLLVTYTPWVLGLEE